MSAWIVGWFQEPADVEVQKMCTAFGNKGTLDRAERSLNKVVSHTERTLNKVVSRTGRTLNNVVSRTERTLNKVVSHTERTLMPNVP